MKDKNSKNEVIANFIWRFAERCGAQGVTFIVSIILARLLDPSVYGTIALVTVFITILNVFVDSGLGNALIQKKDADDLDFSSVFYFNIVVGILLYIVVFLIAPWIAAFYEDMELTALLRVLGITLLIAAVKNIQQAYVSKTMQFKKFFWSTLGGTLGSAVVGIAMAYFGYGVWALIAQLLFNAAVDTVILWVTVKWRPGRMFSYKRLRGLFGYGWKLLVSALIDTGYNNLRNLIIGKIYSKEDLSFYDKANRFPSLIILNINNSIDSVLFPSMSEKQESSETVKHMTRRAIQVSTYLMAPLMTGMAVCAEPMIRLLLTEKWMPCVSYLRIFCIVYMFYPIHTANLNAIKAMGRSDLFLKLEIIKKTVGMVLLLATMRISVMAMAYSLLLSSVISQFVNSWPNWKLLNYNYLEQLKDMLPGILLSAFMGGCVWGVQFLPLHDLPVLLIQVISGIFIYVFCSKLFKIKSYLYLMEMTVHKRN